MENYLRVLRNILVKEGVPYGFTLTIWATGLLGIERYQHPTEAGVILFIGGAIAGYALFALLLQKYAAPLPYQPEEEYSGVSFVDFLSVPIAVGLVVGVYHVISMPLLGLPLASFVAVVAYNLVLAAKRSVFRNGN